MFSLQFDPGDRVSASWRTRFTGGSLAATVESEQLRSANFARETVFIGDEGGAPEDLSMVEWHAVPDSESDDVEK